MSRPLIDRMAEALTALLSEADEFASLMPKCEEGSPSGEAERALAEYRNRPPEISQETARWKFWKDDTQQPIDSVFGWWVGTEQDNIWIEHEAVARTLVSMHNAAIARSQETARELLANLKIVTEPERKVGYVGDPYAKWPKLRKLVSLIARAEAELKGKP